MQLTEKQHKILGEIAKGNGRDADGNLIPIDLDQLLQRLDYAPSKDSMHFSIRALVRRGLVVKGELQERRGRLRVVYIPSAWVVNRFAQKPQMTAAVSMPLPAATPTFDLSDLL